MSGFFVMLLNNSTPTSCARVQNLHGIHELLDSLSVKSLSAKMDCLAALPLPEPTSFRDLPPDLFALIYSKLTTREDRKSLFQCTKAVRIPQVRYIRSLCVPCKEMLCTDSCFALNVGQRDVTHP
jgi:hypothetical protein